VSGALAPHPPCAITGPPPAWLAPSPGAASCPPAGGARDRREAERRADGGDGRGQQVATSETTIVRGKGGIAAANPNRAAATATAGRVGAGAGALQPVQAGTPQSGPRQSGTLDGRADVTGVTGVTCVSGVRLDGS